MALHLQVGGDALAANKFYAIILGLLFAAPLAAIPTDCSRASVQAAVDVAITGETVTFTSCDSAAATWEVSVAVGRNTPPSARKSITIDMGGYSMTYAVPNSQPTNARSMFTLWMTDGSDHQVARITNGSIDYQAGASQQQGIINTKGGGGSASPPNCYLRIDHINFTDFNNWPIYIGDEVCGVIDHNTALGGLVSFVHGAGPNLYGGAQGLGSLAHGVNLTGADRANAVFIEDNTINFNVIPVGGTTPTEHSVFDAEVGGRQVARMNKFINVTCTVHGLEQGLQAGAVQNECYLNDSLDSISVGMRITHWRSGTGVIWGNATSDVMTFGSAFDVYRTDHDYGPGDTKGSYRKCTGIPTLGFGPTPPGTDIRSPDQIAPGGPFASGTASAIGTGTSMQDTGAGWTEGQWVGYSVLNTMPGKVCWDAGNVGNSCSTTITANTEDTLTIRADHIDGSESTVFAVDDTYEIWRAETCLNQTGMDGGSLMTISDGVPYFNGTDYGWPGQVVKPTYVWQNTDVEHGLISASTATPLIVESRHFLNENNGFYTGYLPTTNGHSRCTIMTFNASCGVGVVETLGGMDIGQVYPTCTKYVGLWIKDLGNWNSGPSSVGVPYSDQGQLFQCEEENTWGTEPYYEPYDYPHPLTLLDETDPVITTLTPDTGAQATTVTGMEIAGLRLNGSSPILSFDPSTGITTNSLTCPSAILCTVNVVIAPTATVTSRAVTIASSLGASNAVGFDVTGLFLESIDPIAGNRSSVVSITFTGTAFNVGGGTITENCVGTTVSNIVVGGATTITADFTIAAGATLGTCQVAVVTNNGTSNTKDFNVVAAGAPTIDSISPSSGRQGRSINFSLVGNGFEGGNAEVTVSGSGVSVVLIDVVSDSSITGTLTIDPDAELGDRTIHVVTDTGSSNPGVQFQVTSQSGGTIVIPLPVR